MEIKITIEVSRKLESLLERLCESLSPTPGNPESGYNEVREEAKEEAKEEAEEEPKEEPKAAYPDDEEMRTLMDMTIAKFANTSEWKVAKDERTLAIRKQCTTVFKDIAKWLGADKPTQLEGEKRNEFVKSLDNIFIEEKEGKIPSVEFHPF